MNQITKCPFCLDNELLKVNILFEDDLWYFTDMLEGSINNAGMAITKRHIETPFDINHEEWVRLHSLLPKFKKILDKVEVPQGYNIGWNVYGIAGQHVNHAHMHIVARYDDEPLSGKGIRYAFKQEGNRRPNQI
ncbi:MAG: HIT domain-containing protein [bacterium]